MDTYRKTAVIVGALFIVGTVAGILSGAVTAPISAGATFPLNVSASATRWIAGALLVWLMGLSLAMMPVVLYPILKEHSQVLALGAVLFRGAIEALSYAVMVISMLLMVTVSETYVGVGAAEAPTLHVLRTMLAAAQDWAEMWGALAFGIGALMIYAPFYRARLVPRWLSAWGLVGTVLYLIANLISMFGPLHAAPDIGVGLGLLLVPTAIQEMVLAVWLIVKGFHPAAVASLSARPASYLPVGTA